MPGAGRLGGATAAVFEGIGHTNFHFASGQLAAHRFAKASLQGAPIFGQAAREVEKAAVHRTDVQRQAHALPFRPVGHFTQVALGAAKTGHAVQIHRGKPLIHAKLSQPRAVSENDGLFQTTLTPLETP